MSLKPALAAPLILALTLGACGGKSHGKDGGLTDGLPATQDGAVHSDGSVSPPGDGAAPQADAKGSPFAGDYYPLATGLTWTYKATRTDGTAGTECSSSGTHTVTVSSTAQESGATVFVQTLTPGCYFKTIKYRRLGGVIDVNNGAWYRFLELPPQQGKSWAAGGASGASYTWEQHYPTYKVAAGSFSDCWKRKQSGYEVWEIYCKGVGMVLSHYAAWGGDARQELTATSGL